MAFRCMFLQLCSWVGLCLGIAYATLSMTAQLMLLPSQLTRESHPIEWYFAQCDRAIRTFPLDHSLWKVPLDLLKIMPPGVVPPEVLDKVLRDADAGSQYPAGFTAAP